MSAISRNLWFREDGTTLKNRLKSAGVRCVPQPSSKHWQDTVFIKRDPEGIKRGRNLLFLGTAKEKYLGKVVWETATERHKQLDDTQWLVAYFTAQGKGQKRIASITHLSERRIGDIIREIKDMIGARFEAACVAAVVVCHGRTRCGDRRPFHTEG